MFVKLKKDNLTPKNIRGHLTLHQKGIFVGKYRILNT